MFSDATVYIKLPADLEVVGKTIIALSAIGYDIPAARGKSKMFLDCGRHGSAVVNLKTGEVVAKIP